MLANTLKVLRGTVAAQVLGLLSLPLLTRLFTPEAFGLFQLFQATMGLFLVVAAMRYEIALLRAADGRELAATLLICGLVNLAVCMAVALGCALVAWWPMELSAPAEAMLWWLPAGVLVAGALQTLGYLPLRHKEFTLVANVKVIQALASALGSLALGLTAPIASGLVLGDLLGRAGAVLFIGSRRALLGLTEVVRCTRDDLLSVVRRFREFPLVAVPGGLVNAAGGTMTSVMMFAAFDASTAGQYGLVERAMIVPVGMVAGAVSQVFTADLSASLREGGSRGLELFRGLTRRMFMLGLGPALAFGALAPWAFRVLFGPTWEQAGEFARIMSPLILVVLVTASVNMAIMIAGFQKVQLAWELLRLAAMLGAWLVLTRTGATPSWAVGTHVCVVVLMNLSYLLLADHVLRRPPPSAVGPGDAPDTHTTSEGTR